MLFLGWAFAYRHILHSFNLLKRPEAFEVGEGSLSKLFAGKVYGYLVSPRYRRPPRVHLHRSENRMSLHPRHRSVRRVWRTSCYFIFGRFCAAHVALKKKHQEMGHARNLIQHLLLSSPGSQQPGVV